MSVAITTIACVPSLFHSLGPVPSSAEKNQKPLTKANSEGKGVPPAPGKEDPAGLMSFTKLVPFAVPSVFHSSKPVAASLAARSMMLSELALLAPPPHPASPNADASARALVTLHSGPIKLSSRCIMAPTFHPRDRPQAPAVPSMQILPLAGVFSGLDQRPVPRLELARQLLRFQALGDVADHGQARRPAVEFEIEGDDFDVDLLSALLAVPRHALHVGTARILKILEQLRDVLRRAELLRGHRQKLFPRVAVMVDGRLVHGEETQGLVFHDPHRTGMDVDQHPVPLLAVFQVLQRARLFRDVFSDAVVPLEFALRVENRLAGHAQVAHFAGIIRDRVYEIAERLVTLELFAMLLPGFFRKGPGTLELPTRLADEGFRVDAPLLYSGELDEPEIFVLHPVPVRAQLHHAPESGFARLERILGQLEFGVVVAQSDEALRRTRAVAHQRPYDLDPEGRTVLAQITSLVDASTRPRQKLQPDLLSGLQIVGMGDVPNVFLQQLLLAVAEHAAQRFIYARKDALWRYDCDPDRGLREERAEQGIAVWNGGPSLQTLIRFHETSDLPDTGQVSVTPIGPRVYELCYEPRPPRCRQALLIRPLTRR